MERYYAVYAQGAGLIGAVRESIVNGVIADMEKTTERVHWMMPINEEEKKQVDAYITKTSDTLDDRLRAPEKKDLSQ